MLNSYNLFMARRYFSAKKHEKFVSIISFISLIGIAIGIAVELLLHYFKGFPLTKTFSVDYTTSKTSDHTKLDVNGGVIFTNYYTSLKKQIVLNSKSNDLVIDFAKANYLSHSAWTKINSLVNASARSEQKISIINVNHLLD